MIKLLDDLYLDNDNLQFILKKKSIIKDKKSKNYGKETFSNIGYYPKLEQLLKESVMKKIKEEDYHTLEEMIINQNTLIDRININLNKLENYLK